MSMPRRKTCSLRNSLWSWSSTGVRFMGEKPIAGCPAWRWGVQGEAGTGTGTGCPPLPKHSSCLGLQVSPQVRDPRVGWHHTHRSDVATVGGSREDLKLELQLPAKRDSVSAWAQGQPGPLSPCHPAGKENALGRSLSPAGCSVPFLSGVHREMPQHGMKHLLPTPAVTPETPGDPPAPTRGCPHQGPALPGDTTHMSLQTPLKAFHHGSDSSVEVTCWSMHF